MKIILKKSPNKKKKFRVTFPDNSHVDFGAVGYSDYTKHKNPDRKKLYLKRHGSGKEDWSKKGIKTAGFWSRWLLWGEPSLSASKKVMEKKFNLKF